MIEPRTGTGHLNSKKKLQQAIAVEATPASWNAVAPPGALQSEGDVEWKKCCLKGFVQDGFFRSAKDGKETAAATPGFRCNVNSGGNNDTVDD